MVTSKEAHRMQIKRGMSSVLKQLGFDRLSRDVLKVKTKAEFRKYANVAKNRFREHAKRNPDAKKMSERGIYLTNKLVRDF